MSTTAQIKRLEPNHDLFNESLFPIAAPYRVDFEKRVRDGKSRAGESSIVIAGLVRNLESILPLSIQRLEKLASYFGKSHFVIFENDSTDQSKQILNQWVAKNPNVSLPGRDTNDPENPTTRCLDRAERMAGYRNSCLRFTQENVGDYDFYLVYDMDIAGGFRHESVLHSLSFDGWDFVGSNGIQFNRHQIYPNFRSHHDAWAFRNHGSDQALKSRVVNHMRWEPGGPLKRVNSCFGGLGLYRMASLVGSFYSGEDCEHVTLHRRMRENGFEQLFLNPAQVVHYGRREKRLDSIINATNRLLRIHNGAA